MPEKTFVCERKKSRTQTVKKVNGEANDPTCVLTWAPVVNRTIEFGLKGVGDGSLGWLSDGWEAFAVEHGMFPDKAE